MGQIKFQINAKTGNELKNITIIRKTAVVKIKSKLDVESEAEGCVSSTRTSTLKHWFAATLMTT